MYFDINLKLLSGKSTQKVKQTKYLGFVKLGVWWIERDKHLEFLIWQCNKPKKRNLFLEIDKKWKKVNFKTKFLTQK